MDILYDSHVHTTHSEHPAVEKATMEEQLLKGIQLGLQRIYFTDHTEIGFPQPLPETYNPSVTMPKYYGEFQERKEQFSGRITPMFGIELGFCDTNVEATRKLIEGYAFDFVMGSMHHMADWPHFRGAAAWDGLTKGEVQAHYIETFLRILGQYDDVDVLAHITYFARMCPFPDNEIRFLDAPDHFDTLFRWLIQRGKGIEINTSSYGEKGFFLPGESVVSRYRELGGEILTVGSDAHGSSTLGCHLREAYELMQAVGFSHYTIYENRKPVFIKL